MHLPPTRDTMGDARPESEDYVVLLKSPAQAPGPSTPHLRRRPSVQFDDTPRPPHHYTPSVKRGPRRTKRGVAWAALTALGVVVVLAMARNRKSGGSATVDDDPSKPCEARGFLSPAINDIDDAQRIAVRVTTSRQSALPREGGFVHENTIQPHLFHPSLSSQVAEMFGDSKEGQRTALPSPADTSRDDKCIRPFSHVLDFKPRPLLPTDENPELFFALCTSSKRAVRYAQTWSHFMLGSNSSRRDSDDASAPPPGCLVTDADGTRDSTGMTRANDEFRRHGLGCVMRDTSRTGQRYELRVLGLLRDAWVESELRRWRDGAAVPDWFVFGDDDTWYSDVTMLREFLARHNPADEHFFGTFSETRQNYEYFVSLTHCVRVYFGLGTLTAALLPHRVRSLSAAAGLSSAALCLKKCKLGSTNAPYASEISSAVTG